MAVRQWSSGVWEYFAINATDESKVSCSISETVVSQGGKAAKSYNTTNLRKHLETKHPEEYRRLEAKEQEASKAKGGVRQMMMAESIEKAQPYTFDHPRAREIHKHIGEMIAVDSEPFTLVDHIGFTRLMKLIEPRYKLPSDKYFSENWYQKCMEKCVKKWKFLCQKRVMWASPLMCGARWHNIPTSA